jgi:hypothetical protein
MTRRQRRAPRSLLGQSLVEFALLLPLLLLLLLGAIDFGRVFFGWVAVNNAARVGADYAATQPDACALSITSQQDRYAELISQSGATNCDLDLSDPTFPDGRDVGDRARVSLSCEFELITAVMAQVFGGDSTLTITANATFPIRKGCADCIGAPTAPPPPPPANCRSIPDMAGMSVAGARLAWTAAGFTGEFEPESGEDAETVASFTIDQGGELGCDGVTNAFFSSSVTVDLAPVIPPSGTCITVPNLIGMTVSAARVAWEDAGFDPANFDPLTGDDNRIVDEQTHTPTALPGQCMEPDLAVSVTSDPAPPPPPPPPCRVPEFVNTPRAEAQSRWGLAQFTTTVQFHPPAQNWTVITQQSLVAGTWAGCASTITLSR